MSAISAVSRVPSRKRHTFSRMSCVRLQYSLFFFSNLLAASWQHHLKLNHSRISPMNVPAARMANPSPRPHTRPIRMPMTIVSL